MRRGAACRALGSDGRRDGCPGPTKRTRSTRTRSGTLYSEYRHFATRSSTAGTPQAVPQHLRVRRAPSLGVLAPRPPPRRTASADRPARRPTHHPQRALSAALSRRAVPQHLRVRRAPSLGVLTPTAPPHGLASVDRPASTPVPLTTHLPAASAQCCAAPQVLGWTDAVAAAENVYRVWPAAAALCRWQCSDAEAVPRARAFGRIDVGAIRETHGWARHFGASHRHFAGKWSWGHTWAWRIIILVITRRVGGLHGASSLRALFGLVCARFSMLALGPLSGWSARVCGFLVVSRAPP